jgi:hypothetical protein
MDKIQKHGRGSTPPKLNAKRNVQEQTAPKVGGKKKTATKTGQTKV